MTMIHPIFMVEEAMKTFIMQWYSGLQPSLRLRTNDDGSIQVNVAVTSSPLPILKSNQNTVVSSLTRRHRSGKNARLRRNLLRKSTNKDVHEHNKLENKVLMQSSPDDQTPLPASVHVVDTAIQAVHVSADAATETEPFPPPKMLSTTSLAPISIPPRAIYHPAIINATKSFYNKHPSDLSTEETREFKIYLEQKQARGDPVEQDLIYLPSSMRKCLHCGHLT